MYGLQVVTEHIGRQPLRVGHARTIEAPEVLESPLDVRETLALGGVGVRRDLLLEAVLLVAGKIARRDREVRVQPHPAVADGAEEIVDRRLLLRRRSCECKSTDKEQRRKSGLQHEGFGGIIPPRVYSGEAWRLETCTASYCSQLPRACWPRSASRRAPRAAAAAGSQSKAATSARPGRRSCTLAPVSLPSSPPPSIVDYRPRIHARRSPRSRGARRSSRSWTSTAIRPRRGPSRPSMAGNQGDGRVEHPRPRQPERRIWRGGQAETADYIRFRRIRRSLCGVRERARTGSATWPLGLRISARPRSSRPT